jgi:phosphonate metabolism protein PhnN/1,5-bisphosphokinase (PRPP-forming)
VGASGAGKDTLLNGARRVLRGDTRFRFIRRVITRPPDPDGEDHESVSEAEFRARGFALQWEAHGLLYGIPVEAFQCVASGSVAVANVSRLVLAEAAQRFPVHVIEVTAPASLLAQRLAHRGRESAANVELRLRRSVPLPHGLSIETVVNDSTPDQGVARFIAALNRAAAGALQ